MDLRGFAIAFLVKMPLVPFHGWLPDGYKAMPIPAVAVFSAILSKVAAYGFLRIVLPLFPYASVHFQTLMLIIALVSVLWGTVIAMTTPDARLVVAYSMVAQLGFIVLGIFTLTPQGAQGALIQMANHALVTVPLFFIVAAAAMRSGGSEKLADMGGIAFRAPVLATLALIITLANLAMPGSSNFIGEFNILLGAVQLEAADRDDRLARRRRGRRVRVAVVHPRDAQSRRRQGDPFEIRRWEAFAIVPMVLLILVFAFYPQFALRRSQSSVKATIAAAHAQPLSTLSSGRSRPRRCDDDARARHRPPPRPPHRLGVVRADRDPRRRRADRVDHRIARGRLAENTRARVTAIVAIMAFAASLVIEISRFDHPTSIISSALRIDDLSLILDMLFAVAGIATVLLSLRSPAPSRPPDTASTTR